MSLAAGEIPDQPGIHRAEQQFAPLGALACARDIVQNPFDLGSGEIGVDQQAGFVAHVGCHAVSGQFIADRGRAPALPNDGVVHRLAGVLVPDDGRFALVRDADACDIRRRQAAFFKRLAHGVELRIQNDHGVVLDPARLGINLREGILRQRHDVAALVKNNRTGACGALIQSHNVTIHEKNLRFS